MSRLPTGLFPRRAAFATLDSWIRQETPPTFPGMELVESLEKGRGVPVDHGAEASLHGVAFPVAQIEKTPEPRSQVRGQDIDQIRGPDERVGVGKAAVVEGAVAEVEGAPVLRAVVAAQWRIGVR